MSYGRTTRRELVSSGVAVTATGAAAVVSALASPATGWAGSAPAGDGDASVLARTLSIEQLEVFAYRRVLSSGSLQSWVAGLLGGLLSQELRHVSVLESELRSLGGSIPAPPHDVAAAQRALAVTHVTRSLTELHTQRDCLKLLIDVESVAEGAYFLAIGKLGDRGRVRTAAGIMGCEAQHWTILSGVLNGGNVLRSVPYPFVAGST